MASVPVLLFCLAFGLSMDYEVFLISRIREYWLASGKTHADNAESVALGLARTGRVVTAAALLMAVTFASLMAAKVSLMCIFGVGVTMAVLVDATLVRMVLVPAFMRVLGRLNWWAPGPLARLHRRIGISESAELPELLRPSDQQAAHPITESRQYARRPEKTRRCRLRCHPAIPETARKTGRSGPPAHDEGGRPQRSSSDPGLQRGATFPSVHE